MNKVRQVGKNLSEIRDDHLARYRLAAKWVVYQRLRTVLDVGCGVGYGAVILANNAGAQVHAVDRSAEALEWAARYFDHERVRYYRADLADLARDPEVVGRTGPRYDLVTAFEVIEHSPEAPGLLRRLSRGGSRYLMGSVPNEDAVPFDPEKHNAEHYRHYTMEQLSAELREVGWWTLWIQSQPGKVGPKAEPHSFDRRDRTLVFLAERLV